MKRLFVLTLGAVFGACLLFGFKSHAQRQEPGAKFRRVERPAAGQYIVVLDESVVSAEVPAIATDLAVRHGGETFRVWRYGLKGFAVRLPEAAAIALSSDPRVKYVEEDPIISLASTQYVSALQPGLDRIDQRNLPLDNTYNYDYTGAAVNVYVIDTGISTSHQEFGGRADTVFDAYTSDGQGGRDCIGHGTHVAGIIGGSTYGVAKNARLHSVRVYNCAGQTDTTFGSSMVSGINWVTQNHVSPSVANISSAGTWSSSIDGAVVNSINSGVTYVVAAGNNQTDASSSVSPADVQQAITVGATDNNDYRAWFSNYGWIVDIFAPGEDIASAWPDNVSPIQGCTAISGGPNTSVVKCSGTSMAAPHVAGVAALYLQANPGASPGTVRRAITSNATQGKIPDPGANTANRLLFSRFNLNSTSYPEPDTVPLYRFHTDNPLRHFYTTNQQEGYNAGYVYEGIQCYIYPTQSAGTIGLTPLYRFHADYPLRHFYTTNQQEGYNAGYTYDQVQGYVYTGNLAETVPLYRFHALNPVRHFYTTDQGEGYRAGFQYDGVQGYVYRWW